MDCCELALKNANLAWWIAISAFGTIALLLLMLFGYNLWLDKRTIKLEKKNGHEQHQLDQIKEWMGSMQKSLSEKDEEIAELKTKLKSHD